MLFRSKTENNNKKFTIHYFFYCSYALVHCSCFMNSAPALVLKKKKKKGKKCRRRRGKRKTRFPNTLFVSVWIAYFLSIYFTIQLIFATIYESHCTFWYYSWVLLVLFQLTFTFIYNTFSKKFSILAK